MIHSAACKVERLLIGSNDALLTGFGDGVRVWLKSNTTEEFFHSGLVLYRIMRQFLDDGHGDANSETSAYTPERLT